MTKWNEEVTAKLRELAGDVGSLSRDAVTEIADEMDISFRSASSKLRKEGYTVEAAGASPKSFTDEETEALRELVTENSGQYTYAEIAEQLGTDHSTRSIMGKLLSMELMEHVAPTPAKESEKTYSDAEEQTFIEMSDGYLEEIAEALNRPLNSVRGKALSLLRAGKIDKIPEQKNKKPAATDVFEELGDAINDLTVEQLVEKTGKTVRGVKTILTRRKLKAADYDGAARSEKAAA